MKKLVIVLFSLLPVVAQAAGGGDNEYVVDAPINLQDKVSLQNGAQLYVNYCQGCHSLKYLRYKRMAEDLEMPEELVQQHLNWAGDKIGDPMDNAMDQDEAQDWFGVTPPDLTLVTRWRSPDWVYSYLTNFYEDETRPFGYNNHVFLNVGMPHVMAKMERELGEEKFKQNMGDLTNFLTYAGEPFRMDRERIGVYVLVFLFILFIPAYFLYKEYWKDVH